MTDIDVYCEHGGQSGEDRYLLDVWSCDATGRRWTNRFRDLPIGLPAEFRAGTVTPVVKIRWDPRARVDHAGLARHNGGVTRTKRGWRFQCGTCGRTSRVLHRRMLEEMDDLRSRGETGIDLADLDTPTQNTCRRSAIR